MNLKGIKFFMLVFLLTAFADVAVGQDHVPFGIHYQAVARDNFGKELVNTRINVRFSVISGDPTGGSIVYQELHQDVVTSPFGVFSLVIGQGVSSSLGLYDKLADILWESDFHYLKVEVKFGNDFIDMGIMQFLAVPYALYAQKSLEPGPEGPKGDIGPQGPQGAQGVKGDPGDPASDDQTLSFDGTNLSISIGDAGNKSTVNLSTLNPAPSLSILGDTLSIAGGNKVGLPNHLQDLSLDIDNKVRLSKSTSVIDLTRFLDDKQQLNFNSVDNTLVISGGNAVDLTPMKQDLQLSGNTLTITNKLSPAVIDLTKYMQQLTFTEADSKLAIAGGNTIDLSPLKNDADADPTNEIQDLNLTANKLTITNNTDPAEIDLSPYLDNTDNQTISYNAGTNTISLTNGGSVNLGTMVAFRARKITEETDLTLSVDNDFITPVVEYNDGFGFNDVTGIFTAPSAGIYTFVVGYSAGYSGDSKILKIFLNGLVYEILNSNISFGSSLTRSVTMKLNSGDQVKVVINVGVATTTIGTGTGSFSGFRVY
jgi:hypothetical protein